MPEVDAGAIGWYGISMGTAYGLPFVAAEPRIRAAVLGMWGTSRVNSQRLVEDARRVTIPVLFQQKRDDEFFTPEGQVEIYEALASPEKQLAVYEGGHVDPAGLQLFDLITFLTTRLQPKEGPRLSCRTGIDSSLKSAVGFATGNRLAHPAAGLRRGVFARGTGRTRLFKVYGGPLDSKAMEAPLENDLRMLADWSMRASRAPLDRTRHSRRPLWRRRISTRGPALTNLGELPSDARSAATRKVEGNQQFSSGAGSELLCCLASAAVRP